MRLSEAGAAAARATALFGRTEVTESEPDLPAYTGKVALTWSAPTGRGKDVRCSAVSLQNAGFSDFLIIDSETHQILRPDGTVLPTVCRVKVDINILHLNADAS
jgi:hypothetical protein